MFKVPFYTGSNYKNIISKDYSQQDLSDWIDFKDIIGVMDESFIKMFESVSINQMWTYVSANKEELSKKVTLLSGKQLTKESIFLACKYLMPTLWNCDYFVWKKGSGKHHGIDIILPKGTPLIAFGDGEVTRIKAWDGKTKNEGNCVVIKSQTKIDGSNQIVYLCYEHMDSIDVSVGQKIKIGDVIGKCGTTGNSTQFHLHFQVDNSNGTSHPFWSASVADVEKYTLNPFIVLRNCCLGSSSDVVNNDFISDVENSVVSNPVDTNQLTIKTNFPDNGDIIDLPSQQDYKQSILGLVKYEIIKQNNGKVNPDGNLLRYEFALLISRILEKFSLIDGLSVVNSEKISYSDVDQNYSELVASLQVLGRYGIMKGKDGKFMPYDNLTGEQTLAVLLRLFYGLTDYNADNWAKNYMEYFVSNGFISKDWKYFTINLSRKEVFKLLALILIQKGKMK